MWFFCGVLRESFFNRFSAYRRTLENPQQKQRPAGIVVGNLPPQLRHAFLKPFTGNDGFDRARVLSSHYSHSIVAGGLELIS